MAYRLLIAPQTAGATTLPTSFVESEQLVLVANGLATTEKVTVNVVGSLPSTPLYGAGATPFQYQLTATAQAMVIPGGYILSFVKDPTAAAVGVEVHEKPRAAFAA